MDFDLADDDCTIYIEELKSDDPNLKINAVSKIGNTPLHSSCLSFDPSKDHTHKYEEFLLDSGAKINA